MKKYVKNKNIVASSMGEELGMLNSENGMYYVLDGIGHDIWKMINEPINLKSITEKLLLIYEVEEELCMRETEALLEDMVAKKIILEV